MINYTTTMRKRMEITTDQESLLKAAKQSYYANEDTNLNADRFLSYKRKQGETNLIKSAILNKLSKGEKLSPKQQMYLDQWKAKLNSPQNEGNDDLMLPYHHSNFTLDDISKDDLYKLNSLQSVDFNGLDRFPLNDLVLELSQLIDPLQLKTVESNLQQELMREEWGIKTSTVPQSKAA